MKKNEKVKLFSGGSTSAVERKYNNWYADMRAEREGHSSLSNMPFVIMDRKLVIRVYEGAETFALAVFYEDYDLEDHERGSTDRAGHVNGTSAFPGKKR